MGTKKKTKDMEPTALFVMLYFKLLNRAFNRGRFMDMVFLSIGAIMTLPLSIVYVITASVVMLTFLAFVIVAAVIMGVGFLILVIYEFIVGKF